MLGISPHLFTRFISIGFPIEQADGADEFEDNNIAAPEPLSHNIGASFQRNPSSTNSGVFGSLKIVLLKSKLNLLIPCGFFAILINYLSQNKVISYTNLLLLLLLLEYLYFFFGLLLILLLCFSEGLGISSEPVGYHSFG